ncbi:MAG: hypothetical protein P1P74_03135 [Desulfuromonadales bacterium]|nr:hypothetical protein [Desulfuromonadales bacterium]
MSKQWSIFTLVLLASFLLSSCGSEQSSDSATLTPFSAVDAQKSGDCTSCHAIDVHTKINGIVGVNTDAAGVGLGSAITHDCEDCHGGGQYHRGVGPIPYPSPDLARCAVCHNNQTTKVITSKHNAARTDNTDMLVDSGEHYLHGYCQRCHTAEGSIAFKDVYGTGPQIEAAIVDHGTAVVAPAKYEALVAEDADGNVVLHEPACGACHNALTKKMVTVDAGWDPNQNGTSDQLDLCTSCHNYKSADGAAVYGSGDEIVNGAATVEYYHNNSWYRQIPTTHYDDPTTLSGQGNENLTVVPPIINKVEGYVIRENSENPCFDCHGHELLTNSRSADDPTKLTIQTAWAKSAHGGKILTQVMDAVAAIDCTTVNGGYNSLSLSRGKCNEQVSAALAAYTSDSVTPAWTHYDWDKTNDTVAGDRTGRAACQMCHTATGAANFMSDQANYNPANNDYSHLSGWSNVAGVVTSSPQNEVIYCWACHTSAESGALRTPGAITLAYQADGADITLPDMGNSNVCYNCHSGRGNMDSLIGAAAADPAGAAVTGGTKTHYFASGATIYQSQTKVGYMYAGQSYTDKPYFAHDTLGCAECHMTGETPTDQASHTFDVVEKDGSGVITAIASKKCVECHDGEHALFVSDSQVGDTLNIWDGSAAVPTVVTQLMADDAAAEMEHEAHGYHNAVEVLGAVLTAAGTPPQANYPYFSGTATDQGHGGAMHNWSYLHHEPGAYAHNRYYAKRLIFDSIDWLTNATNGSVDAAGSRTLDGALYLDPATYGAAITWLGGDTTTGIVSTRP